MDPRKINRWAFIISLCFSIGLIIYSLYTNHYNNETKQLEIDMFNIIILIAPPISMLVAFMVFVASMINNNQETNINNRAVSIVVSALAMVAVGYFSSLLTNFKGWQNHFLNISLLFGVFMIWDFLQLKVISNDTQRKGIEIGNRLINRPTIFSLILVFIIALNIPESTATKSRDYFIGGLISFHLFFSAVGYFANSVCGNISESTTILKPLKWLFYWLPPGPQAQSGGQSGGTQPNP